jgi:hypothetical protein
MNDTKSEENIPATKEQLPDKPKERNSLSGSKNDTFTNIVANQTLNTLWLANSDEDAQKQQFDAAIGALRGINPKDEIEGLLAAQMIAVHSASMECFRRAMIKEQGFEGRDSNLKHAAKLTRSYGALVDSLQKYRGKGQQKMTVEHVHVHYGGQAIVGNVER